ncbi:coiled-coil domain-containing protein mad1 [Linnemannia schmuckeri]|uniref:Spindle assembly checkpoint component MAD1 n=1 Tax=Linnemannia schmuckeri TaxID=64567 RepID=A0A9P5VFS2_9FUNG|nr:coiled-coil domain-containing protein mad1 [Linnemannia schmuckeri]
MSSPTSDPDLVRRFMNRPLHSPPTGSSSTAGSTEIRTPFGEKRPTPSPSVTPSTPSRLGPGSSFQPLWSGSENAGPAMSFYGQYTNASNRSPAAAAGEQDQENQYPSSRIRTRIIEPDEYESTRKKLRDTQYELSSTRTEMERKIVTMEQAARESDILKRKLMARVDSLESDRRFLYEQEKSLTKKVQALEEDSIQSKMASNEIIKNLRDENMSIKDRLSQLQEESREKQSELTQRVRTLTASLTHQQQTLAETQDSSHSQSSLVAEKHQKLAEALDRIMELEDQNRQLKLNTQGMEDVVRVQKELQNQVAYIKQLEGTNRQLTAECKHLKDTYRNVEVLKEEKLSLEQKLKLMDDLRIKCSKYEVQNGVLLKEKEQWVAFLEKSDKTDFNSPYELAKTIATLRGDKTALMEVRDEFQEALKSRDAYIEQLEQHLSELKTKLVEQEEFCSEQSSITRRHEMTKDFALRQVESLKEQLKSYDTEEVQLMGGTYDSQKNVRIEQLEKLVQECQAKLESMASSANNATEESSARSAATLALLQSIRSQSSVSFSKLYAEKQALVESKLALRNELELLRKENSSLDAKILEHEIAIGAGAFNPAVSRVLEIKDSPAARHQAVRQQMLDALKEENAALLQSLTDLQQQQQPAGHLLGLQQNAFGDQEVALEDKNVVPVASYNRLLGDFKRLQEEFADNDKRSKRLKQSWTLKADEFLDAVRSLLGYKVNFLDNGRVELISVYNAEEQQSFVFTSGQNDEGTMQLVGSGSQKYMEEHKESFDHWVNQLGSIPAFLSRVTLDLVEQQAHQLRQQEQQQHQQPQYRPFQSLVDDDDTQNSDMMVDP